MTIQDVVTDVAYVVGVEPPASATADTLPSSQKILRLANMAGDEIARRCDWRNMLATQTIVGDGVKKSFALNPDFARLVPGGAVRLAQAPFDVIRGSLSSDAWRSVASTTTSAKFFRLFGTNIEFSAFVPNAAAIAIDYVSKNWANGSVPGAAWVADTDTSFFPERLLTKNIIYRWKRQNGLSYQDEMQEFEADLAYEWDVDRGFSMPKGNG